MAAWWQPNTGEQRRITPFLPPARSSFSSPFYWVLVIWLSILFGSFGLTARPNALVMTMTVLCALSIAIAV